MADKTDTQMTVEEFLELPESNSDYPAHLRRSDYKSSTL